MKSLTNKGILLLGIAITLSSCKQAAQGDFQKDESSGILYHFFKQNENGQKPKIGDYAELELVLKNSSDSIIFDSRKMMAGNNSNEAFKLMLTKSFHGCLPEGIVMMSVGDSASFKMSADSVYLKTFQSKELPHFIKAGSDVIFYVKLLGFENPGQLSLNAEAQLKEREQEVEKRKTEETGDIEKFLNEKKLNVKPEPNGIYILERHKGKGKTLVKGDSVEVKYTGALLDGTVAETSDHGPGNQTFVLVYGRDYFIKGFDDIIANLEDGGMVKALIPSKLAYGAQKQSHLILPYTPLLYTVEIIKVH
jgi:FKBP-type peptidyl-prolyl cis-trans isomerase